MFQSTCNGLDVPAQSIAACALIPAIGEVKHAKMAMDRDSVLFWIQRFPSDAKAVYEAGPTGSALARHPLAHGVDCVNVAPSKLLRAPGEHIKTDKRDARSRSGVQGA
ncbi:hypothetical protein ACTXPA_03275 [Glutamicibacter arilaitensis]|uniref:hypothetical protein n=1 Tax=Glutamicibacter arilaitensis TaxID=256701 RepID=UPI003FD51488